jgi:hypothetical protein
MVIAVGVAGCGGGGADSTGATQLSIAGTPLGSVAVGSAYSFQPAVTAPSGVALTFSVQGLPAWATFDAASGRLQGTPQQSDVGTYPGIIISVSDGSASTSLHAYSIQVMAAASGSATLSWTVPTQNTDGSALSVSDISGFHIYYGTDASNLSQSVTVNGTGTLTRVIDSLTPATWFFSISVIDVAGVESARSSVVSVSVM